MSGPRIAIIGCGMSGILAGVRLKQAGLDDFVILEKAAQLGGTWRDNRYPGLRCDVPAAMFAYSFAPNHDYSSRFPWGNEIQQYLTQVFSDHQLQSHVQFNATVQSLRWQNKHWSIELADGRQIEADCVISACGILHHPQLPNIQGRDTFQGDAFHTARWPENIELDGKRVGIIGTGSTATQIIPWVAERASRLFVYQRTPHWVFPLPDRLYSAGDRQRLREHPRYASWLRWWYTFLFRWTFNRAVVGNKFLLGAIQRVCLSHIRRKVKDPQLAAKLTPDYQAGCKRLVFARGYYEALQRDNVQLVTDSIAAIGPRGVQLASGTQYELDAIIYATGFHAHNYMRPIEVIGRDGVHLNQAWSQGAFAHRSVAIPGFPNFFMIFGPYSPIGNFSAVSVAEVQMNYVLQLLQQVNGNVLRSVEPRHEVTNKLTQQMRHAAKMTVWMSGCNSWYLDEQGVPPMWPWTFERFAKELGQPRLDEYVLTP